ncbi:MAG: alanine racemase [Candidatus Atribacteria bacterium]|nr:alanine racemase [Candidatus Atribacteria bacterium]
MDNIEYPSWMEINARNLRNNYLILNELAQNREYKIIGVVKSNAYGHGVEAIKVLAECGLSSFAVGSVQEGVKLRKSGIKGEVIVLEGIMPEEIEALFFYKLTPVVSSCEELDLLRENSEKLPLSFYLFIDTGMGRMGFLPLELEAEPFKERFFGLLPQLKGVMTHFACAETDPEYTRAQLHLFIETCHKMERIYGQPLKRYCANSAAFLTLPEARLDGARIGIALFGVSPTTDYSQVEELGLKPVMNIRTRVTHLKELPPGYRISYGATFTTWRTTKVAIAHIGYYWGLPRNLSNKLEVILKGKRVPVLGTITMEQVVIDVTEVEGVQKGDVVTVMGEDGGEMVRPEELAERSATIPHEILCNFGKIECRKVI